MLVCSPITFHKVYTDKQLFNFSVVALQSNDSEFLEFVVCGIYKTVKYLPKLVCFIYS